MSVPALPRHPAVRVVVVAVALVLLLVVTTSIVKASTADAVEAEIAASAAAEAAEARRAAAAASAAAQEEAEREEAERLALLELAAARDAAVVSVAAAQAVLDASVGRVADDAVRVALADAIAAVDASLTGSLTDLQVAAAALAGAQVAVTDAQAAWETEQARVAAEAQAAAEQAAQDAAQRATPRAVAPAAPAPAAPAAPQCVNDSTYTGTPFYTSAPGAGGDGSNGNIPASQMTRLTWGHDTVGTPQYLRTPAAQALDRLNAAYRARFGSDLDIDLTYRSYDSQVAMRNELGTIAAVPGTSSHGTGNALDVPEWSCYAFGSVRRDWLVTNGPAYGWVSPSWARQGSSNPEYWHYEFTG